MTETTTETERGIRSEIVREYLLVKASPEQNLLYGRAFDLLDAFGIEEAEFRTEQLVLLSGTEQYDNDDIVLQIETYLTDMLHGLVSEHGVKLDAEIRLMYLIDVLEALQGINESELSEALLDALQSQEEAVRSLCACLELTGSRSAEHYLNDIWYVDPGLLVRIAQLHEKQLEALEHVESFEALRAIQARIKHYHRFLETENTHVYRAIRADLVLGLPLAEYMTHYRDLFVGLTNPNAAVELYGFALISAEHAQDPQALLDPHFERLFGDMNRSQEVRRILRNVFTRYQAYCAEHPL